MLEKPLLNVDGPRFAQMSASERAKALWGGKYKLTGNSSQWLASHPDEEKEIREAGIELGLIGRTEREQFNAKFAPKPQHQYTEHEARCLAEFSEADVNRFYKGYTGLAADSLGKLAQSDPAKAERLRVAAVLRGVPIPERPLCLPFRYSQQ